MTEQTATEFIKKPYAKNGKTTYAKVINRIPMDVGGLYKDEDLKFFVILQLSKIGGSKNVKFVGKEFMSLEEEDVKKVVKAYDTARHIGLPVPPTTRYFETDDLLPALLMTDMTENGKYKVWGYNNNPTDYEDKTFHSMRLTHNEAKQLQESARRIMELATQKNFYLQFHNYQIRQENGTRNFEIILLDFDEYSHDYPEKLIPKENNKQFDEFVSMLFEKL